MEHNAIGYEDNDNSTYILNQVNKLTNKIW